MKIKTLWQKLFPPKPQPTPIMPGQVWVLKDDSPWLKQGVEVRILDCKDKWVRYAHGKFGMTFFQDERMKEEHFRRIYVPVGNTAKS